jgi:hypothetical protein
MSTNELAILYQALHSPFGLCLTVTDFTKTQQLFNRVRSKAGDPDLSVLRFAMSPYDRNELWIIKESSSDQKAQT